MSKDLNSCNEVRATERNDYSKTLLITAAICGCVGMLIWLGQLRQESYRVEPPPPKRVALLQVTPIRPEATPRLPSHEADAEPSVAVATAPYPMVSENHGDLASPSAVTPGTLEAPTPSVVVELPVIPPTTPSSSATPIAADTNGGSALPTPLSSFTEMREAIRAIRGGEPVLAQAEKPHSLSAVPPIAVPKGFSTASPSPTPTPNVWQRSRNVPTNLIQTPYPIQSNYSSGASTSDDSPPLTDAGSVKFWKSPLNALARPNQAAVTPPSTHAEEVAPPTPTVTTAAPSTADMLARPYPDLRSVNGGMEREKTHIRPTPEDMRSGAAPTPFALPTDTPVSGSLPELPQEKQTRPSSGLNSADQAPNTRPPSTPSAPPITSPRPTVILPPALSGAEVEVSHCDTAESTTQFTIKKGRAQVTFLNVPASLVHPATPTAALEQPAGRGLTPETDSKLAQTSTLPETVAQGPEEVTVSQPRHDSPIERGLERLADSPLDSPLARRLATRALAASVGEKVLTQEDIQQRIRAMEILRGITLNEDQRVQAEGLIVQQWVEKTAIAAEAQRQGLTVSDEEVQERLEEVKARLGQNWPEAMRQAGFTEEQIFAETRTSLLSEKFVERAFSKLYPEEQIRKTYETNPERFRPSRRLHLYEIFKKKQASNNAAIEQQMREIRRRILAGADFSELARQESESPTREKGGDLGWIDSSSPIAPKQAAALVDLRPGQVSDVIELADGYQLLKLVEIKEPRPGYEGARDVVIAQLKDQLIGWAYETALRHFDIKVRSKPERPRPNIPELILTDKEESGDQPGRGVPTPEKSGNNIAPPARATGRKGTAVNANGTHLNSEDAKRSFASPDTKSTRLPKTRGTPPHWVTLTPKY